MNILINVLNQFGANLTNLVAVALAGLIAKGLSLIVINGHKYLLKRRISKYVLKFIPQGIAYGDMLKGIKPNHERLVQAVLTVVLIVAKCNVNVRSVLKLYFLKQSINSSKV